MLYFAKITSEPKEDDGIIMLILQMRKQAQKREILAQKARLEGGNTD